MWRATIRFSLDKDHQSKIRNTIEPILKQAGFGNVKTGTWEVFSRDSKNLAQATAETLAKIESSGKMDHFWVHIEKLSERQKTRLLKAAKLLSTPE
jgi:hypothetical protein